MASLAFELIDEFCSQYYSDVICWDSVNHFSARQLAVLREDNTKNEIRWRKQEDLLLKRIRREKLISQGWGSGAALEAELNSLKALDYKIRGGYAGRKSDEKKYTEYRKKFVRYFIAGLKKNLTVADVRESYTFFENNGVNTKTLNKWIELLQAISLQMTGTKLEPSKSGRGSTRIIKII